MYQDRDSDGQRPMSSEPKPIGEVLQRALSKLDAASDDAASKYDQLERDRDREDHNRELWERLNLLNKDAGKQRAETSRFDLWKPDSKYQHEVAKKVSHWSSTFSERELRQEGLVLYGPVGTGKDHLAYAAARMAIIMHGARAVWANGREMAGMARDGIREETGDQWLISLASVQLLIVSDPLPSLGELTTFQADALYRIYEKRNNRGMVTITTINVADDAEADRRLGAATWDRACHRAWKICCRWPSHRKPSFELKPPA